MVSIHNTNEFHNYIYSLPVQDEPNIHTNTILEYLSKNHTNIYNMLQNNRKIYNLLNNKHINIVFFLPISDNDKINFLDYIYKGSIDIDNFRVVSESGKLINVKGKKVNDVDMLVKGIKLRNGVIHIIKNKF